MVTRTAGAFSCAAGQVDQRLSRQAVGHAMGLARQDILADRACRVMLRDRRYTRPRTRALIHWLQSDWQPTCDVAGRALAELGPCAFEDLLAHVLRERGLPRPNLVWAMELFPEMHDRLLPWLRDWLFQAEGTLRIQCAVSLAHVLTERLRKRLEVAAADTRLVRSVLEPLAATNAAIRVHLRDFEQAAHGAG